MVFELPRREAARALLIGRPERLTREFAGVFGGGISCVATPRQARECLSTEHFSVVAFECGAFADTDAQDCIWDLSAICYDTTFVAFWDGGQGALEDVALLARFSAVPVQVGRFAGQSLARLLGEPSQYLAAGYTIASLNHHRPRLATAYWVLVGAVLLGHARHSVADLARAVGLSQRRMAASCRAVGLPAPVNLLGWGRALWIIASAERGIPLQTVARTSGEPSVRNMSEYVRYHTGFGPRSWVKAGGVNALLRSAFGASGDSGRDLLGLSARYQLATSAGRNRTLPDLPPIVASGIFSLRS